MPRQFRNISPDALGVSYGVVGAPHKVPPDGVVTVTDAAGPSYECQPDLWQEALATPSKSTFTAPPQEDN